MFKYASGVAAIVLSGFVSAANAQSMLTEHTYRLDAATARSPANLEDVAWLIGSWSGTAFGDVFEQVWNPPSAGSMVGMFKLLDGDEVAFYELLLLVEEEGSLSLKVKHFNPDFSAWEEKDDYLTFRLVSVEDDAVHFSGLSFHRIGDDEIHGYIAMRSEGETHEQQLIYDRNTPSTPSRP